MTNPIPFLNLKKLHSKHRREILQAIETVTDSSAFIGGESVEAFERQFSEWVNPALCAVGCGNGTDALTIAARALSDGEPNEAILPAMTFVATAEAITWAGYRIRLVDVLPDTWLMDPAATQKALTQNTRLIVPVHLYGQMADVEELAAIAGRCQARLLEDAAQAHGARWKGFSVGHWGDAATFSFFPGKNLGALGDGGAIVSRDRELVKRCSMLGKHGGLKKYEHEIVGQCSRLDAVQAAILSVKLKYIDEWTECRRRVATWYREYLSGAGVTLPLEKSGARHVYHLFVIEADDRDRLAAHLKNAGIETGIHYPKAIHEQAAFRHLSDGDFPQAERIARRGLSLPMCPTMVEEDVRTVAQAIRRFYKG